MLRIVVDRDKCTGLGMCEAEAPELFEVQDDGTLAILNDSPSSGQRDEAEAACLACPTEALSLVEDGDHDD
ncbi:MAG TPA: ferredoxin [Pseudonocardia sp.]|jgi:ferredoxin|nr:ferredoxin [Pseudonocardia sp.]